MGDTIAIEKLKNSIVINNKGELLFPRSEFGKKSEARNRLLVDLLARTDFMEKAGTGIKRVTNTCVENGNRVHFEFSDSFWITIQSNKSSVVVDDVVDDVVDERLNKIIDIIKGNKDISASQIANVLNISNRTAQRDIDRLKQKKLIQRIGPAKGGHWEVVQE